MSIFDSTDFTRDDAIQTLKVLAALTHEITKLDPDGTPPGRLGHDLMEVSHKLYEFANAR